MHNDHFRDIIAFEKIVSVNSFEGGWNGWQLNNSGLILLVVEGDLEADSGW